MMEFGQIQQRELKKSGRIILFHYQKFFLMYIYHQTMKMMLIFAMSIFRTMLANILVVITPLKSNPYQHHIMEFAIQWKYWKILLQMDFL